MIDAHGLKSYSFDRLISLSKICLIIGMIMTVIAVSGCARLNSIYRNGSIPADGRGHAITVDSKQRHVFFNPESAFAPQEEKRGGDVSRSKSSFRLPEVRWRICAEAAPDVFSAYAASGALEGRGDRTGGSGKLGFSAAETAATIERTQAVNLLRESLYRTCERYLSGAINRTMFIIQAARDQRSMIAFLAIEQLTRVARPPSTIISGPPTSLSIKDGEAAAKLVETFREEAGKAKADLAKADADLTAANKTGKCLESDTPPAAEGADAQAAAKQYFATCINAKVLKSTRAVENQLAQARLDQALALADATASSLSAATSAGATNSGAGVSGLDSAAIGRVAEAVVEISKSAAINEPLMFCISYLSNSVEISEGEIKANLEGQSNTIVARCLSIIEDRADQDNLYLSTSYTSGPGEQALFAYLDVKEVALRKKRLGFVSDVMKTLGLKNAPIDIAAFAASGDDEMRALVQKRAQQAEDNKVN